MQLASLALKIIVYTESISGHPGWIFFWGFWDCEIRIKRKRGVTERGRAIADYEIFERKGDSNVF